MSMLREKVDEVLTSGTDELVPPDMRNKGK